MNSCEISSKVFHFSLPSEKVKMSQASWPGNQKIANTATIHMSMRTTF